MSAVETVSPPPAPKSAARGGLLPVLMAAGLSATLAAGSVYLITARHSAPAISPEAAHESPAHSEPAPAKKGSAQYLPLSPPFTVNLADADGTHFLQVDMEVMARDAAALDAVKQNMPQIRNALLLLLGAQKMHDVITRESKEALQRQVAEEIRMVVSAENGKPGVESVFFTSFVVQ